MLRLRPARPDLLVRDPDTRAPLPKGGATKERTTYWLRRLNDGDVVEVPANEPLEGEAGATAPRDEE